MDDGGGAGVQEVEPPEDLSAPALEQLQLHLLEALQVPEKASLGHFSFV